MNNTKPEILKLADLALVPPALNTSPLPKYGYDKLDYGMTVGVERTRGGRLWASWVGGGDNEKAFMVFATSDDSGETWSSPRLVIDPHDDAMPLSRSSIGGMPWLDPKGRLWIFFALSTTYFDGRMGIWATRCDDPDSDTPEWAEPERIWHGFALNKPIVLSNGEWLLPSALWPREMINNCVMECVTEKDNGSVFAESFHELDAYRMSNVLASRDEGQSWELRGSVPFPCSKDFEEPVLVERSDGTIWMIVRTLTDGMWQSFSQDNGATWSTGEPFLAHVNSRHLLRRLPSGRLLMVKHGFPAATRPKSRSHLTAYLSDDDGVTWRGGLMLDARDGVSYPDGAVSPNGDIFVSYDRNRDTDGEVLLARFTEQDVLAGRCVTEGSALSLLVSRPNPDAVAARHTARKESIIRRLVSDTSETFVHIPRWQAWNGVGDVEATKLNMNNGGAFPALAQPLPPETDQDDIYTWQDVTPTDHSHPGPDAREGFVSFGGISPPREGKVGYARAFIHCSEARKAIFLLGADYWMQFRVNGQAYLDHSREMRPSWAPDLYEFRCDAPLRAGWNLLEVKVASGYLGFAFACQVNHHPELQFATRPVAELSSPR